MSKLMTLLGSSHPTVTIPRYMLTNPGVVAEGFESAAQWAPSSGSAANNTTAGEFTQGTQSVKLTAASTEQRSYKYPFGPVDISALERIYLDVLHHDAFKHLTVRMYDNHARSTYIDATVTAVSTDGLVVGTMFKHRLPKRLFSVTGGQPYTNPIVDIRLTYSANGVTSVSVDNLILNAQGFGAGVILCFDDGYASAYNIVFPILSAHNIRANVALMSTWPESAQNKLTWAQLQTLDAAGWCVINHGDLEGNLAGQDLATQTGRIQACITALEAHGLTKGSHYLAYTSASFDATTLTAMDNLGMLLGRQVGDAPGTVCYMPFHNMKYIPSMTLNNTKTVQQAKDYLDLAITDKALAIYHMHDIDSAGEWTSAQVAEFCEYIVTKFRAGAAYPLTFDDFYKLHAGSVQIPRLK